MATTKSNKSKKNQTVSNEVVATLQPGEIVASVANTRIGNSIVFSGDKKAFRTRSRSFAQRAFNSQIGYVTFALTPKNGEPVVATIRRIEGTVVDNYDTYQYEIARDNGPEILSKTNFYHFAAGEQLVIRTDSAPAAEEAPEEIVVPAE